MGYRKEEGSKWINTVTAAFAGLLCIAVLALLPAGKVHAQAEGKVTASSANIRSSADTDSTAVASVVQGDKLTITEEVTGADGQLWYKVFVDADSLGYIRADLVSKEGGSSTTTAPETLANTGTNEGTALNTNVTVNMDGAEAVQPVSASVTKDQVRVRADSSTNSDIVTTVKKDVVFTVHGTKTGEDGKVWYQVSFMVDGSEVKGYIRSDFVTLDGELLPVTETLPEAPEAPEEPVPEEPAAEAKAYDTEEKEGVWHLVDNATNPGSPVYYPITKLISSAEENAELLIKAQNKVSRQTGVIVVLAILLVLMLLGITLLIFKIKDMMEEDGFDMKLRMSGRRVPERSGSRPARASGSGRQPVARPAGTTGARPAGTAGARPAGTAGARPAGTAGARPVRPAGARPVRPAGARPAGTAGARPVRPAGARPAGTAGARPVRPAGTGTPVSEERLQKQTQAHVEARNLEKNAADTQAWKSKNFMAEDDEFEFEFLNWDGEEEK